MNAALPAWAQLATVVPTAPHRRHATPGTSPWPPITAGTSDYQHSRRQPSHRGSAASVADKSFIPNGPVVPAPEGHDCNRAESRGGGPKALGHSRFGAYPYMIRLLGLTREEVHRYRDQARREDRRAMPGAVRASAGINISDDDVRRLLAAVAIIAAGSLPSGPLDRRLLPGREHMRGSGTTSPFGINGLFLRVSRRYAAAAVWWR